MGPVPSKGETPNAVLCGRMQCITLLVACRLTMMRGQRRCAPRVLQRARQQMKQCGRNKDSHE
jgi:hypothetical protein